MWVYLEIPKSENFLCSVDEKKIKKGLSSQVKIKKDDFFNSMLFKNERKGLFKTIQKIYKYI